MNNEMPWVNLTPEEIQELRNKKHTLTEYGREQLRKLMGDRFYPDEMFDALEVTNKEREKEEWERKVRSDRILQRYNSYHNLETSGLPHGTPITAEQQQMIAFRSMVDALKCEHLNQEYTHIAIDDIEDLIEGLYQQSISFLDRVKKSRYNTND
jgi:Mn-dependent DtxR family transcriptional regulator